MSGIGERQNPKRVVHPSDPRIVLQEGRGGGVHHGRVGERMGDCTTHDGGSFSPHEGQPKRGGEPSRFVFVQPESWG